ncbi:SRPBCC family protein [Methyloligella sp. 2.7D]|uniref:SRPBCC family protein n=1 Tax=unclassified Methyloligella TaxID=2625955 RepID=UPI00157C1F7B|nr:SRPBCC family protein [Methyloligella sp. GL2]QKP76619.1 SRPBCC family protein [Methyloligella sp. GL2]
MKKIVLAATVLLTCSATSALALDAKATKETTASPEKAWAAVGDFCGIASWHPAIIKCVPSTADGHQVRTLSLKGGGTIEEELVSRDDKDMHYTYKILKGPLPVDDYESVISVTPKGDGSMVSWSGTFKAKGASDDDATKTVAGIYEAGVDGIVAKAEN